MARITGSINLDAGTVENRHVAEDAAIDASKVKHSYSPGTGFALAIGGTPATREEIVHVANSAGTVRGFHAMLNDTGTTTNIDFDLKKNGVSILSAAVNIVHGDADRLVKDGVLSGVVLAADDVLSIAMTVTSATGAQGPFAWVTLEENSAPA